MSASPLTISFSSYSNLPPLNRSNTMLCILDRLLQGEQNGRETLSSRRDHHEAAGSRHSYQPRQYSRSHHKKAWYNHSEQAYTLLSGFLIAHIAHPVHRVAVMRICMLINSKTLCIPRCSKKRVDP